MKVSSVWALGGLAAAVVAGLAMWLLRSTLQVRSLPERLLEWSLLFIPLDVFESGLDRFGFNAKVYALDLASVLMLALLTWLGIVALRCSWSTPVLLGLGVGLWLVTMLVIMPLTSAGLFATSMEDGARSTVLGYLAIWLAYASVLSATRALILMPRTSQSRRWALSLLGGTGGVMALTFALEALFPRRTGLPTILVADPQEPVPSGGLDVPNAHPNVVAAAPSPQPSPVGGPTPVPTTAASLPEPGGGRSLSRDQDGAVLPSGRRAGELAEAITGNDAFYIVTKNAGGDPVLHPNEWRLVVDGEVQRSFELDYAALRKLPTVEMTKTLECISNLVDKCELAPFGCDLISTATWRGVRVSDILGLVGGVKPGAAFLATISADEYTTAIPMDIAMAPDALLVFEMNGQVLPREHGYPARLLIPGRYGMKSAKWVIALRPMTREFVDWYGQRSWSRQAIVKTMTRIDVPASGASLEPGAQRIAGVAYAGDRGIRSVEYSADGGGTWRTATVTDPGNGPDSWVRWEGEFMIRGAAQLTLMARAIDGTGSVQSQPFQLAQPDGGGGWNTIAVKGT